MTDALLTVRWKAPGLHQVVSVHRDRAWVWSMSGIPPWADRVGTFTAPMRPSDAAATLDLAEQVHDAPDAPADQLVLLVSASQVTRRVGASSILAGRLMDLLSPIVERAVANPVSAFAVTPPGVPMPTGVPMLAVSFRSLGTEPVELTLAPDSLRGFLSDGSLVPLATARMGLVDASTRLLDGILRPAVLEPGSVAGWALPALPGGTPVRLRLAGTVRLVGPWSDGLPEAPFEVEVAV